MASLSESDTRLSSNSQPPQSEIYPERTCNVCAEQKIHSLANEWCVDCRESLCNTCSRYHKRYQPGHTITDIQDSEVEPKIVSTFDIHTSAALVSSIYILDEKNDHIIVCEWNCICYEIIEYIGEKAVSCCKLEMSKRYFFPDDITSVSPDTLVVACSWNHRLCFVERGRGDDDGPTLKLVEAVRTKSEYCSLSCSGDHIYACDRYFGVDVLMKNGDRLRTLKCRQLDLWRSFLYITGYVFSPSQFSYYHRIRANPSTRTIWMLNKNKKQIFCFSDEGNLLKSFEGIDQEEIEDICVNGNGLLYYCNRNGVFSLIPQRLLYRFRKSSECDARIYVLRNKIFASFKNDGKTLIKCIEI